MKGSDTRCRSIPRGGHRALVGSVPNGVLVHFGDGLHYRIVGPDVLSFSGRRAEDMTGKPVDDLFPDGTVAELKPELCATLDGRSRSFDIEYDGRIDHVEPRPTRIEAKLTGY